MVSGICRVLLPYVSRVNFLIYLLSEDVRLLLWQGRIDVCFNRIYDTV